MTKEKKTEKKRTTIYIPDDLKWRMKEIAPKLRITSDTKAVEAALKFWVEQMEAKFATKNHADQRKPA